MGIWGYFGTLYLFLVIIFVFDMCVVIDAIHTIRLTCMLSRLVMFCAMFVGVRTF